MLIRSYAWYLLNLGRFDEARAQIKYAEELDPVSPVSRNLLAYVDVLSGQTDLAIEEFTNTGWDKGLGLAYGREEDVPGGRSLHFNGLQADGGGSPSLSRISPGSMVSPAESTMRRS